jgi:hypothetical protein
MHWTTLEMILTHSEPPGYRVPQLRDKLKLGPYVDRILVILQQDKQILKKQRHNARRIYERLRDEGALGRRYLGPRSRQPSPGPPPPPRRPAATSRRCLVVRDRSSCSIRARSVPSSAA